MITKIKHSTKGEIEIHWRDTNSQTGECIEHKLVCGEPPRPELDQALQAFAGYVIDLCELPADYREDLTITGVSISDSESLGPGIVVTSLKKVSKANAPVVINTPHLSQEASSEGGPCWPPYVDGLLRNLEGEAMRYRMGQRAQQELPMEPPAAPPEAEEEVDPMDLLYADAVTAVREEGHASVSMLQNKLHIDFATAIDLIDRMQENQVVAPADGSGPRRVLPPQESASC